MIRIRKSGDGQQTAAVAGRLNCGRGELSLVPVEWLKGTVTSGDYGAITAYIRDIR